MSIGDDPVTRWGGYEIRCGDRNQYMSNLLPVISEILRTALADLSPGPPSHGYDQIFGANTRTEFVSYIFEQIIYGAPITAATGISYPPWIMCVDFRKPRQYHIPRRWVDVCREDPYPYAYHLPIPDVVVVCPRFWTRRVVPPRGLCPGWFPRSQRFDPSGPGPQDLWYTQGFMLVHELVHRYLRGRSLSALSYPTEKYDWNEVLWLHPKYAILNPMNYQIYAYCKYC